MDHHARSDLGRADSGCPREEVLFAVFAHRAPLLLLRFVGVLLLRFEESRLDALLFQLPPRITRLVVPLQRHPARTGAGRMRG